MGPHRIEPLRAPVGATIAAPPSKSATHRALFVAALADGRSTIHDPLDAGDTRVSLAVVRAFGAEVREGRGAWSVLGFGGSPRGGGVLDLGESGTSLRFAAALAACCPEPTALHGRGRLPLRPMGELYAALEDLGGRVAQPAAPAVLPATVSGPLGGGRVVRVAGHRSSQFVSALLVVAPRLPGGLTIEATASLVSADYVALTCEMLERFGIPVERRGSSAWSVSPTAYSGRDVAVEGDWSSASCLLVAPAILGGYLTVTGLRSASLQPDRAVVGLLEDAGCEVRLEDDRVDVRGDGRVRGFEVDLSGSPDLGPVAAALALFAEGPCVLRGVGHLRHKESDRLAAIREALTALGRRVRLDGEALVMDDRTPKSGLRGALVRTGSDHRMAMAFAVAGLRLEGVAIDDSECVSKSYPGFWIDFDRLGSQNW